MIYQNTNIKRVLTLMPDCHIGNLVVSLPAIVALQKHFQGIPHYFIVDSSFKEIVETIIDPAYTLFYPRKQTNQGNVFSRSAAYLKFLLRVKRLQADITIDLEGGKTSAAFSKISGAGILVSRANADRHSLYSVKVDMPVDKHKVYSYTAIAEAVGAESDERPFRFYPEENKKKKVDKLLSAAGVAFDKPVVSIHPGAGRLQKLWNISGFVEVTDWLTAQGCQVVFVGGPDEAERAEMVIGQLARPAYNFVGKLSLGELLPLLERSAVFLGNDSGPMHMAAAMGASVVAMFSYADDREWGPRSDNFVVLRGQEVCEKCIKKKCQDPKCINTLSPELVKKALASFI